MSDYTTVAQANKFLQYISYKDLGFASQNDLDTFIGEVLPMASRFIDRHCNRPDDYFKADGITITEYFHGIGSYPASHRLQYQEDIDAHQERARKFSLSERPVISVTTVSELESGSWTARTKGDSTSYDYRHVEGQIYFWKNIPDRGWNNLKVVYVAGYAAIPSDVGWVCARLVANELQAAQEDYTTARVSLRGAPLLDFEDPQIFTKDLAERLRPFVKIPMGVL